MSRGRQYIEYEGCFAENVLGIFRIIRGFAMDDERLKNGRYFGNPKKDRETICVTRKKWRRA